MGIPSDETVVSCMGIRAAGCPLCLRSSSKRTKASFDVAAVDSFSGLSFARTEGSYHTTHFVESLKTFALMFGEVLQSENVVFHH
jgi:hypothetical protein